MRSVALLGALGLVGSVVGCGSTERPIPPPGAPAAAPGPVTPPPAVDPAEKQERDFLDQVADSLDAAQDKIDRTAELPRLPGWAYQNGVGGEKTVDPQSPAAEHILQSSARPRLQAVAMLWLASRQDLASLPVLEPFLDSTEPAGKFPQILPTQAATRDFDHVTWIEQSLGQVALWAIGDVLYRDFSDVATYRAWRTAEGDLTRSYDYWKTRLERTWDEQRGVDLEALRATNPELYFRVVVIGHADWVDPAVLVETARDKVGRTHLMSIVRGAPAWPEMHGSAHDQVSAWLFDHWHDLFGDEQSQVLLELWMTMAYNDAGSDWVRARLAIATGNAYPERRREILVELLDRPPGKRIADAVAELARHHFKQERARLARLFFAPEEPDPSAVDNRLAVIEVLAADDKRGRASLKSLLIDRRFRTDDRRVIAAIAKAVTSWGAVLPAECEDKQQLAPNPRKGEAIPDSELEKAKARRAACVSGAIGWLRKQR